MDEVALADIGGRPASVIAPKVRKVPPPAMALTIPDNRPAVKSSNISRTIIGGFPPGLPCPDRCNIVLTGIPQAGAKSDFMGVTRREN